MEPDFNKYVNKLADDTTLDLVAKKGMLESWRERLIEHNSNIMMDKETAEKHFEWLAIIDSAIARMMV